VEIFQFAFMSSELGDVSVYVAPVTETAVSETDIVAPDQWICTVRGANGDILSQTVLTLGTTTPVAAARNALLRYESERIYVDTADYLPTVDMSAERADALSGTADARAIRVMCDYQGEWSVWGRHDGVNWSCTTTGFLRDRAERVADALAADAPRGTIYAVMPDLYGPANFDFFSE
jgi:hypothetical protein